MAQRITWQRSFGCPLAPLPCWPYIPYESDGIYLYCGLAQNRVPMADWYPKFKVPHYVVYRVRVE